MLAATTMVSGKKRLKDRITRIAQKPQRFVALTVAVMLLLGAICAFTFTGAAEEKNSVTYTDHIANNIYVPVSVEEQMKTYVQRLLS